LLEKNKSTDQKSLPTKETGLFQNNI
jgi:hypothetical protein